MHTKKIVLLGLFIALKIIVTRYLGITIGGIIRIDLSFLVVALMASYTGPFWTAIGCGIADVIGTLLFPVGAFFPGFTLSAAIGGLIYGLFLYKKHFSWWRIIMIQVCSLIIITFGLNTLWLGMITGKGYLAILPTRVTKELIMVPIEIILLGMLQRYMMPTFKRYFS